jgi:hypothetical protein
MTAWTADELARIGGAEELRIASLRRDGALSRSRTIWVVRVGDDLYVRSVNGPAAAWYRSTQVRHEGHIQAGGVGQDVSFAAAADEVGDQLDAAYRGKYHHYAASIVGSVVSPRARSATLRLMPR